MNSNRLRGSWGGRAGGEKNYPRRLPARPERSPPLPVQRCAPHIIAISGYYHTSCDTLQTYHIKSSPAPTCLDQLYLSHSLSISHFVFNLLWVSRTVPFTTGKSRVRGSIFVASIRRELQGTSMAG